MDGNFHADHIKMHRPDVDVMLTNGQGYMVEADSYKEYMSVAEEHQVVGLNFMLLNLFSLI